MINKKYGLLTVIDKKYQKENKKYYLLCKCGNEKWIRLDSVKSGKQQSCGCLKKNTQIKKHDLLGKKFNRLTVIKEIGMRNNRYTWECRCDCGNICVVEGSSLTTSKVKSCGCLKEETLGINQKVALKAHIEKNIIDNTNISIINREKPMSHNTSGVTGVKWDKSRQKWQAEIIFKNKKYYLGRYEKKEDAIIARKEAEERLHKNFLREKGLIE